MNGIINREKFIKESNEIFEDVLDCIEKLPSFRLKELHKENTAIVIMDMVNGFAKSGALYSPRVEAIIQPIEKLLQEAKDYVKLFIKEDHGEDSLEFKIYPKHCVKGTEESEIVDEFKRYIDHQSVVFSKNSTNGYLEKEFLEWIEGNAKINNFIIVGDCTDICVEQFAITLKTYMNMNNKESEIIVPIHKVDTFDAPGHPAEFMNVLGIFNMMRNGVRIVRDVE